MQIIYETSDYPDVLIKRGMLEQAGFLVHVDNLHSGGGAMPELGFTVGYRIMVPDDDVVAAKRFLNSTAAPADNSALERARVPEATAPLIHPWFLISVALLLLWLIISDIVSF